MLVGAHAALDLRPVHAVVLRALLYGLCLGVALYAEHLLEVLVGVLPRRVDAAGFLEVQRALQRPVLERKLAIALGGPPAREKLQLRQLPHCLVVRLQVFELLLDHCLASSAQRFLLHPHVYFLRAHT